MGANLVGGGATFRTWAPNATSVCVLGDFNNFTVRDDATLVPEGNGHWLGFIPGVVEWQNYKFRITGADGPVRWPSSSPSKTANTAAKPSNSAQESSRPFESE